MGVTSKSLYALFVEEIDKRAGFNNKSAYKNQLERSAIAPLSFSGTSGIADVSVAKLVTAVQTLLGNSLPARINDGLQVTATDPASNYVNVAAGNGAANGVLYTLDEDTLVQIPMNLNDVLYVCLYKNRIVIENNMDVKKLTLAKIVIAEPGVSTIIENTNSNTRQGYIVNYQPITFYRNPFGGLEEDSAAYMRDIVSELLAENLIGSIKLTDDLTITNSRGTLLIDSKQIGIYDITDKLLAKFDSKGTFFYNAQGIEVAKFGVDGAHLGNIAITTNSIQSKNFLQGVRGFQIKDNGDVEFNNLIVRGTIYANAGQIADFTILDDKLYGGTIQTALGVGQGAAGVIMDTAGLRGYDPVLGETFNLPTDGSAPTFSSGIIRSVIFEINTNSILRTSETVGDGSSNSKGILINNTGIYGCANNQLLVNANFKALLDGTVYLKGEINAATGQIGNVTITPTRLSGGLITGTRLIAPIIETSEDVPKIRMDNNGLYYQITTQVGTYGLAESGSSGFMYGDGTLYGSGVTAYLFNINFPVLAIQSLLEDTADIRLYNRAADPTGGIHQVGDLIVVNGKLKICTAAGSPGTFTVVGTQT